jgi:hypothetical protein
MSQTCTGKHANVLSLFWMNALIVYFLLPNLKLLQAHAKTRRHLLQKCFLDAKLM